MKFLHFSHSAPAEMASGRFVREIADSGNKQHYSPPAGGAQHVSLTLLRGNLWEMNKEPFSHAGSGSFRTEPDIENGCFGCCSCDSRMKHSCCFSCCISV